MGSTTDHTLLSTSRAGKPYQYTITTFHSAQLCHPLCIHCIKYEYMKTSYAKELMQKPRKVP